MNVSSEATPSTTYFPSGQNLVSTTRSYSVDSYPSYAPPAYEVATAFAPLDAVPEPMVSEPVAPKILEEAKSISEPIDQYIELATPRDSFDPPPHSFSRALAMDTAYEPLPHPFVVHAKPGKKFLDDAFDIKGTNALESHDVFADDWVQMLQDIQTVAQLTKGQRVAARMLPVTMYMGCTGFFVSRAIEKEIKRRNAASVLAILDIWNERFFKPRGELFSPF